MIAPFFRVTAFLIALILLTGVAYPLTVTAIGQIVFAHKANGSLIEENGKVIGSELIAQNFKSPRYFHPRPSAVDYAGDNSGASNLAVTSKDLNDTYKKRIATLRMENASDKIPSDLIAASASGLDPDISPAAASLQIARIASARNLKIEIIQNLIDKHTKHPTLSIFGMPRMNVLAINRELDKMQPE